MSECPSLTLTVPDAPSVQLQLPDPPQLSFYAASQVPGLALPIPAVEDLNASSFICITAQGLVMASSYPIRPASAYIVSAAASGSQVYVQQIGALPGLSNLTAGNTYFLSTIPGQVTGGAPEIGIAQILGVAVTGTTLLVDIQPPTYLN